MTIGAPVKPGEMVTCSSCGQKARFHWVSWCTQPPGRSVLKGPPTRVKLVPEDEATKRVGLMTGASPKNVTWSHKSFRCVVMPVLGTSKLSAPAVISQTSLRPAKVGSQVAAPTGVITGDP